MPALIGLIFAILIAIIGYHFINFFIYDIAIKIIFGLFFILSMLAIYICLDSLFSLTSLGKFTFPYINIICIKGHLPVYKVFIFFLSWITPLLITIFSEEAYMWIGTNVLCLFISFALIRLFRPSSLRVIIILFCFILIL